MDNVPRPLLRSAIAGADVDSCPHPCSPPPGHTMGAAPCGDQGGECHPLKEDYTCLCPLGLAGVTCEKAVDLGWDGEGRARAPSFGGDGYLMFDGEKFAKK